jgi:hypothetical protein
MSDKHYIGDRSSQVGAARVRVVEDGKSRDLDPRLDLRSHSPSGFQWGYGGSGPSQLALALVADATGDDELAQRTYQAFKFKIVASINSDEWRLSADAVRAIVDGIVAAA